MLQLLLRRGPVAPEGFPEAPVGGVHHEALPRLGVLELHQPDGGQLRLAPVAHPHRDRVVAPAGDRECALEPARQEVRHQKHHRAPPGDVGQVLEGHADVGAAPVRTVIQQLAQYPEHMPAPLARGHELLDAVAEEDQPDLVVVLDRAEGQQGADLHRHIALHAHPGSEIARSAHVHHQHHRKLALLLEDLHEWGAGARGHVPVDAANVVAVLVLAHFGEIHPPSLEDGLVFAGKDLVHETTRRDLDTADLAEDFARDHPVRAPRYCPESGSRHPRT